MDNDGDTDLALQECGGPFRLLENGVNSAGWSGSQLHGRAPNTEGLGARVTLSTSAGRQVRWVMAGGSYQSSSDRRSLFALPRDSVLESLDVDLAVRSPTEIHRLAHWPVRSLLGAELGLTAPLSSHSVGSRGRLPDGQVFELGILRPAAQSVSQHEGCRAGVSHRS